ncbi:hypothetical protein ccbrp13_00600 [Ktedonobacteria bacterium brp13]|nr:hypothetical protein ccbrp13_00600 [Ktedonobacteria bacterium brp13]
MAIITGVKEEKAKENGMTNSLRSVLKMRIIRTGVFMEALVFMLNYRSRVFIVDENVSHA